MIIQRIHQDIKLKWNELDSNERPDIPSAHLDDIINSVTLDFVEIFYSGRNPKRYSVGFEVTQQRIDMLSTLVVAYPLQPEITPIVVEDNKLYEIPLNSLKFDYVHMVRASADSECGVVNIKPEQHDDLNIVLNDPFRKPSATWKRLVCTTSQSSTGDGSSLYIYSDDFDIGKVKLNYLRKPRKVFFGGYDTLEFQNGDANAYNSSSSPVTSDLPEQYHNLLVEMCVQELSRIFERGDLSALWEDKILNKT